MSYVNVGATVTHTGARIPTKTALKRALKEDPGSVSFDGTDTFTPFFGTGARVPVGVTLSVCGPDPHRKRVWYASVSVNAAGVLVVT